MKSFTVQWVVKVKAASYKAAAKAALALPRKMFEVCPDGEDAWREVETDAGARPKSSLYRYEWINGTGYVVYRHCFDTSKCSVRAGVLTHQQATFVDEASAQLYCVVRNKGVDRFGDDSIEHFKKLTEFK